MSVFRHSVDLCCCSPSVSFRDGLLCCFPITSNQSGHFWLISGINTPFSLKELLFFKYRPKFATFLSPSLKDLIHEPALRQQCVDYPLQNNILCVAQYNLGQLILVRAKVGKTQNEHCGLFPPSFTLKLSWKGNGQTAKWTLSLQPLKTHTL